MKRFIVGLAMLAAVAMQAKASVFVAEDFSTDPVAGGRFSQFTNMTESSFTHNSGTENLAAVVDVDNSAASYRSNAFSAPYGANDNAFFQFDFQVTSVDDVNIPEAFVGLMRSGSHPQYFGPGLNLRIRTSAGALIASAVIDQSTFNDFGDPIPLTLMTEYRAMGQFLASSQELKLDLFSGPSFTTLAGSSSATYTGAGVFNLPVLDRVGIQNRLSTGDFSDGSISLLIDNIAAGSVIPEPSTVLIWSLLAALGIFCRRRRR